MTATTDHAQLIAPPPVLYLGTLFGALLIDTWHPWRWAQPWALRLTLTGLGLALGAALARWAFVTLRRHETSANPRQATQRIVQHGPFRWSRNPIYVAMTLLYLGASALLDSIWPLLLLPALLGIMHFGVIRREEAYLGARFGVPYHDYCNATRRWL